jgi:hypothetical protein
MAHYLTDVLVLECSMADPGFADVMPIYELACPTPMNYLTSTLQKIPPLACVQYHISVKSFRQYLLQHVDPEYHHEWRTQRRLVLNRKLQAKRRRLLRGQ